MTVINHSHTKNPGLQDVKKSAANLVKKSTRKQQQKPGWIATDSEKVSEWGLVLAGINGEKTTRNGKMERRKNTTDGSVSRHMVMHAIIAVGRQASLAKCQRYWHTTLTKTEQTTPQKTCDQFVRLAIKTQSTQHQEIQKVDTAEIKSRNEAGNSYEQDNPNRRLLCKSRSQGQRIEDEPANAEYNSSTRPRHMILSCENVCWTAPIALKMKVQKRGIKSHRDNKSIPYGRGSFSIVQANPESFPDEMDRRSRVKMVDRIIESYYDKYQGIGDHMRREVRIARRRQWLRSFTTGRKRRLSGMDWFHSDEAAETKFRDKDVEHVEREAQNFQIQEIASAILAEATKRCYDGIQSGELDIRNFRIVMSVHDQLIFNVHRDDVEEAWEFVQEAMQTVLPKGKKRTTNMPITIDKHVQSAWGEDEYD